MPILYLLTLLFLILFLVGYCIYLIDSIASNILAQYIDAPTSRRALEVLEKQIKNLGEERIVFYDLGCGYGRVASAVARDFPGFRVVGVDRSALKNLVSRIIFFKIRNLSFLRKNIFDIDISNADLVYIYLWPTVVEKIREKLERELKPGAYVLVSTFPIKGWQAISEEASFSIKNNSTFERFFLYKR